MTTIKILFRKNLKMSPQKLAAVCTHIGKQLGKFTDFNDDPFEDKVIVLNASDKKYNEKLSDIQYDEDLVYFEHIDTGVKEVEPFTPCAVGWIEES